MVRHGLQQGAPIGSKRRICIVTSSYPANSSDYAGAFVPDFVSALTRQGCQVFVLTPDKDAPKQAPPGHSVRWFAWAGGSKPLVRTSLSSPADLVLILSLLRSGERALVRLIEEEGIDACLALWAIPAGFLARRACRGRVPYSVWALGADIYTWGRYPVVRALVSGVLRDAAHCFADGIELAGLVTAMSGKACDFLPTTRRLPAAGPLPLPLGDGCNFLYVGRMEPVKGPDVLIDAMARLTPTRPDARLTMCGDGSMEAALRSRVRAEGMSDRIAFVSSQPADVVAGYMAACDCLVIPSRRESIPVIFSDALQAGIPILLTDVGDMGELARRHGLPGPIPAADPVALASAMESFARDPTAHRSAYAQARPQLLSLFDVDRAAQRYLAALAAP